MDKDSNPAETKEHSVRDSRRPVHEGDASCSARAKNSDVVRAADDGSGLGHMLEGQHTTFSTIRDLLSSSPPRADSRAATAAPPASTQIPSTDGILYALMTIGYEIYLHKRVQAAGQPGLLEVLVLALGVALSLGGLAWWTTPGATYMPYRKVLIFSIRLHHLIAVYVIPCSAAFTFRTVPWADYAYALVPPGWILAALLFHMCWTLPRLPSLLLHAVTLLMIPPKSCQCCALPFMDRLEGLVSATLRHLLRPTLLRPLRGRVGGLSMPGRCQVVLWTFYFLGGAGIPACMAAETWTHRMQRKLAAGQGRIGAGTGHGVSSTQRRNGGSLGIAKAVWVRCPSALRLLVYMVALQCAAAVVVGLYTVVGWEQRDGSDSSVLLTQC